MACCHLPTNMTLWDFKTKLIKATYQLHNINGRKDDVTTTLKSLWGIFFSILPRHYYYPLPLYSKH